MSPLDVHILHDGDGRILALAPADAVSDGDGSTRGVVPVPADGQFAVRLTLTEEHAAVGPVALVRDYQVDLSSDRVGLRPQSA